MPGWPRADVFHLRFPSKVLGLNLGLEANLSIPHPRPSPRCFSLQPLLSRWYLGVCICLGGMGLRHLGGSFRKRRKVNPWDSRLAGRVVTLVTLVARCVVGQAVVLKKARFPGIESSIEPGAERRRHTWWRHLTCWIQNLPLRTPNRGSRFPRNPQCLLLEWRVTRPLML